MSGAGPSRCWYRYVLAGATGFLAVSMLASAIFAGYDLQVDSPPSVAFQALGRSLFAVLAVVLFLLARGLFRFRRWAWFGGVALGLVLTVLLVTTALDPHRTAIVQIDAWGSLAPLYLPYLALRWKRYLRPGEGRTAPEGGVADAAPERPTGASRPEEPPPAEAATPS